MTRCVTAVFDGNALRPEAPLGLRANTRCVISVRELDAAPESTDVWALLAGLAGSVEAPADWSANHDHYLTAAGSGEPDAQ